jgi:hypothetical protein
METNTSQIPPKFICSCCNTKTNNKKDYTKHILTAKHKKLTNVNTMETFCPKNIETNSNFTCKKCDKEYKSRVGLWKHNKQCNAHNDVETTNTMDAELSNKFNLMHKTIEEKQHELIEYLMKENSEFKQLMIEQNNKMFELAKNSGNNNNNTTNNFNLQVFLNETCKNAMNIMDFVSQLQVGIKELEDTGRLGFAEGISKIIINGLKQMDISDRPIHCSDSKREVVYIKDKDQWNKETEDKTILTNAIKHVAHKNMKQISEWTKGNPEFNDSTSKQNDRYLNIVCESMSGSSQEETNKNYNKIIKNIVKETIIDK